MTSDNKQFLTDEELDAECDRIMNLTEDELRAEIKAEGLDWDAEVGKVKSIFECAKADVAFDAFLKSGK
jgi:hypothetical protein